MKCTIILVAALGLVLCALSAGCTSPTQAEIKPLETTVPTPPPTTPIHFYSYGRINTACGGNPSRRTILLISRSKNSVLTPLSTCSTMAVKERCLSRMS